MTVYTDSYFHIGEQHLVSGLPNQDYALAGEKHGVAYAIVSDGCSSGGKTDVGARVLAHATERALLAPDIQGLGFNNMHALHVRFQQEIVVASSMKLFELTQRDMLATNLYAVINKDGYGYVQVYGDGVVVMAYPDGSMILRLFSWGDNMPFYLAYANGSLNSFVEAHGNNLWNTRLREEVVYIHNDVVNRQVKEHTLSQGMRGVHVPSIEKEGAVPEYIALFSDGVEQIEGVDWVAAVQELMRYKIAKGSFVKRRIIRALKDYHREGKRNLDDIASAVIRLAPD